MERGPPSLKVREERKDEPRLIENREEPKIDEPRLKPKEKDEPKFVR